MYADGLGQPSSLDGLALNYPEDFFSSSTFKFSSFGLW